MDFCFSSRPNASLFFVLPLVSYLLGVLRQIEKVVSAAQAFLCKGDFLFGIPTENPNAAAFVVAQCAAM